MSWKKKFAARARYEELGTLGAFKIAEEPESLGKGKYRVRLVDADGQEYTLSTYESTIGDILAASGDGYCTAEMEVTSDGTFMRFRAVE